MSQNINLVAFEISDEGKLFETQTDLIETAFITSSLLDELLKSFSLVEIEIFECLGSEEHYSIECFKESDIEGAIKKLEEMFLSILKLDGEKLLCQADSPDLKNLPSTDTGHIVSKDIDDSINRFRTLTNIINVFKLKHNRYRGDLSVVVKIG